MGISTDGNEKVSTTLFDEAAQDFINNINKKLNSVLSGKSFFQLDAIKRQNQ
ncbi:hypothetical protein COLO4_25685 [Corchorus olitorius]|uniref:Uncharacterized protein n=1 Tax=Corchorus olitorius TaxID=93759 RepID=A0A1R3I0F0_9ROSI|nr:hypothetical protein COLO4_25685 [Corchorus olitorius]